MALQIIYNRWCDGGSVVTAACHNSEGSTRTDEQSEEGEQISEERHIKAALYQISLKPSSVDDRTVDSQK